MLVNLQAAALERPCLDSSANLVFVPPPPMSTLLAAALGQGSAFLRGPGLQRECDRFNKRLDCCCVRPTRRKVVLAALRCTHKTCLQRSLSDCRVVRDDDTGSAVQAGVLRDPCRTHSKRSCLMLLVRLRGRHLGVRLHKILVVKDADFPRRFGRARAQPQVFST